MIKYTSGYKYQLAQDAVIETCINTTGFDTQFLKLHRGVLLIKSGYSWDGASGPAYDSRNSMRASLYHDACYQAIRQGWLGKQWRSTVDSELGRLLKEDGMWWPRRKAWVWAVRKFAASAADPKNRKPILEAP
jgi:hypothetical protein